MGYAIVIGIVAALITFVSLLAVSNPNDGFTTQGMADYGVSNQGCLGGCLMLPAILIVRPFEFPFSVVGLRRGEVSKNLYGHDSQWRIYNLGR